MKIIVGIKQVPQRDSSVRIAADGKWFEEEGLGYEINEPDAYALEAALQLKEKHGGEVVVLCAGPARTGEAIREALAKGADRGIHINSEEATVLDALALAGRLADAAKAEQPDLILTGLQSDDLGLGQTGVVMAELLGIPHATIIMQVEAEGGSIRVKRELESGWFQWVEMPMPALLTIQSGISKLRYATLMGIKKAKTKPVAAVENGGTAAASPVSIARVYTPERSKQTQMISGSADEVAARLVEKLKHEVRAI